MQNKVLKNKIFAMYYFSLSNLQSHSTDHTFYKIRYSSDTQDIFGGAAV